MANGHGDAALGRAVQLGKNDALDICHFFEQHGLLQAVLPSGGVDDEQRLDLGLGVFAFGHTADLFQLFHQVRLVVQPSCRIHNQYIRMAAARGLYAVKHHGGGVRALFLLDDGHIRALRPHGELFGGGGAEGVGGANDDAAAHGFKARGELADGGGFAHAVDADNEQHHRAFQAHRLGAHDVHQDFLEGLARLFRRADVFGLTLLAQAIHGQFGGLHAHVGHDEHVGQVLEEFIVKVFVALHQFVHAAGEHGAGLLQPRLDAVKQSHWRSPLACFI